MNRSNEFSSQQKILTKMLQLKLKISKQYLNKNKQMQKVISGFKVKNKSYYFKKAII